MLFQRLGCSSLVLLLAAFWGGWPAAWAATEWSAQNPGLVKVDRLAFGGVSYSDVWFSIDKLVSFSTEPSGRRRHRLDLARRELTLSTVEVSGVFYHDVVVKVAGVHAVGNQEVVPEWMPNDPLFSRQWHLRNTGQSSPSGVRGTPGEDINVTRAWQYASGFGIRLAVVDDGLDVSHPDLRVVSGQSWDFRVGGYGDPSSSLGLHGTATAGLVAARGNNGVGVTGVAFDASVVGLNLLRHRSDANDGIAMLLDIASNDIFVNSYGSTDGTGRLQPAGTVWEGAVATGVTEGRGGKGTVYVWAAGNGAPRDRSDYDGQANHPMVITVSAVDSQGKQSSYSESGSNVLLAAPGGSYCSGQSLLTTDVQGGAGFNSGLYAGFDLPMEPDYTQCMSGTSAAAPLVAGVVALMLEVNPELHWRDVRSILARTARKNDRSSSGWMPNGAGLLVHDAYGFGTVDATAAVIAAQQWVSLPDVVTQRLEGPDAGLVFQNPNFQSVTYESVLNVSESAVGELEFVELFLESDIPSTDTLTVELLSPSGTSRIFMKPKNCWLAAGGSALCGAELQQGFRFGSPHWLGERAVGEWRLRLSDTSGRLGGISQLKWRLVLHGVRR